MRSCTNRILARTKMVTVAKLHVSVLADLCEKRDLMSDVLRDGTTQSQQVRLARAALPRVRDRSFGQLPVLAASADLK